MHFAAVYGVYTPKVKLAFEVANGSPTAVPFNTRDVRLQHPAPQRTLCWTFWTTFFDMYCQQPNDDERLFPTEKTLDNIYEGGVAAREEIVLWSIGSLLGCERRTIGAWRDAVYELHVAWAKCCFRGGCRWLVCGCRRLGWGYQVHRGCDSVVAEGLWGLPAEAFVGGRVQQGECLCSRQSPRVTLRGRRRELQRAGRDWQVLVPTTFGWHWRMTTSPNM